MKKLQKMTLKEMSTELTVISPNELSMVIGGGDGDPSAQAVWNQCLWQLQSDLSPVTNAVNGTLNAISNAATEAGVWVENNAETIGLAVVAAAALAADVYLWWMGAASPSTNWDVMPADYHSNSGINFNSSNFPCSVSPNTNCYSVRGDINYGGVGGTFNDKNELCTE